MHLGQRLHTIAMMVPKGARLADIGTDHAQLPIYLVEKGLVRYVVAGEANPGPFDYARNIVNKLGLNKYIDVRFGNGLAVVNTGEVDTVVIAGMGAGVIIDILSANPEVVGSLNKLILQPMVGTADLRKWIASNGWCITDEQLVMDDGRLYEIVAAERGNSCISEPILYDIGPVLWQNKHELLKVHLEHLIEKTRRVINSMSISVEASNSLKYRELQEKVKQLEDKRKCL